MNISKYILHKSYFKLVSSYQIIFFSSFYKNSKLTHFIIGAQKKTVLGPETKKKNLGINQLFNHSLIAITFQKKTLKIYQPISNHFIHF